MDPPISFNLSDEASKYASHLLDAPELSDEVAAILKSAAKTKSVDLPEMIKVFEWRCARYKSGVTTEKDPYSAYPLLEKASMVLPAQPEKEPNVELQERLKRLAAQQENKEYNKMVKNVSFTKEPQRTPKKSKSSIISGLNFALTLFATCGAAMYLLQNLVPDLGVRAGIGIAVGTVILVIEIFLAVREIERQEKKKA